MSTNSTPVIAPEWSVSLSGKSYELLPSVDRLIAVERLSGLTIFGLVDRAAGDGLTLDQLAGAVSGLAVAESGDPIFGFGGVEAAKLGMSTNRPTVAAAIVEAGPMKVSAALLAPLSAYLTGKLNADGTIKVE